MRASTWLVTIGALLVVSGAHAHLIDIVYSGFLTDSCGKPLNKTATMTIEVFNGPPSQSGVVSLCKQENLQIPVIYGHFQIDLTADAQGGVDSACANNIRTTTYGGNVSPSTYLPSERWFQLTVDGVTLPATSMVAPLTAQNGVPAGTIMPYAGGAPPFGWISAQGQAVPKTSPEHQNLYAAIGCAWGCTDTMFNVPDLRGRFLRGRDLMSGRDPDAASRVASAPGGFSGTNVGSLQTSATARPTTNFTTNTAGEHTHVIDHGGQHSHPSPGATANQNNGLGRAWYEANAGQGYTEAQSHWLFGGAHTHTMQPAGAHSHTITGGGDAETRPENVYVTYMVKL